MFQNDLPRLSSLIAENDFQQVVSTVSSFCTTYRLVKTGQRVAGSNFYFCGILRYMQHLLLFFYSGYRIRFAQPLSFQLLVIFGAVNK